MKTAVILHTLFSEFTYEQMEAIFSLAKEHNGKFRIVPTGIQIYDITKEQKELSRIARNIYSQYPYDGKYILDGGKLIICQSNVKTKTLKKLKIQK